VEQKNNFALVERTRMIAQSLISAQLLTQTVIVQPTVLLHAIVIKSIALDRMTMMAVLSKIAAWTTLLMTTQSNATLSAQPAVELIHMNALRKMEMAVQ
jgi:hypothetical protein